MKRYVIGKTQDEKTGERFIIRIFSDDLSMSKDMANIFFTDSALKHPLDDMAAEMDLLTRDHFSMVS